MKTKMLVLILEDGEKITLDVNLARPLFEKIKLKDIETLVFGEVDEAGKVAWEKQFQSVTVMPTRTA